MIYFQSLIVLHLQAMPTPKVPPEKRQKYRRPPMYETPELLQSEIDKYWKYIKQKRKHPTISGLCAFLGFESRQSFYAYEARPEFCYTIRSARLEIESVYESALMNARNAAGPIFALKNFGWRDEQSVNIQVERTGTAVLFPGKLKTFGDDDEQQPIQIPESNGTTG